MIVYWRSLNSKDSWVRTDIGLALSYATVFTLFVQTINLANIEIEFLRVEQN